MEPCALSLNDVLTQKESALYRGALRVPEMAGLASAHVDCRCGRGSYGGGGDAAAHLPSKAVSKRDHFAACHRSEELANAGHTRALSR